MEKYKIQLVACTFIVVHLPIVELLGWPIIVLQGVPFDINVPPQCFHLEDISLSLLGLPSFFSLSYKSTITDVHGCVHHQPHHKLIAPRCGQGPHVVIHAL